MHPHDRLKREVLGERLVCDRPFILEMVQRDKPLAEPRSIPGEALKARTCEITYRRVWLEPGPNSPLLKRIVKYPYQFEEYGRSKRTRIPMGLNEREKRQPLRSPTEWIAEFRGPRLIGGPLKRFSFRPTPLHKAPPVTEWLSTRRDS